MTHLNPRGPRIARLARIVAALTLAGGLTACDGIGNPSLADGQGRVMLSVVADPSASPAAAATDSIAVGRDVLAISRIEIVLSEIELEFAGRGYCRDDDDDDDDDCDEIEIGPFLVDLPLGGGPRRPIPLPVPAGRYDEIEFEIGRVERDNRRNRAFLAEHPDLARVSIRVSGTFNGVAFTWTTSQRAKQEIELRRPIVVADGATTDLTLAVDYRRWFQRNGRLIDPATALPGGPNEGIIRDNVRRSFRAFDDD